MTLYIPSQHQPSALCLPSILLPLFALSSSYLRKSITIIAHNLESFDDSNTFTTTSALRNEVTCEGMKRCEISETPKLCRDHHGKKWYLQILLQYIMGWIELLKFHTITTWATTKYNSKTQDQVFIMFPRGNT